MEITMYQILGIGCAIMLFMLAILNLICIMKLLKRYLQIKDARLSNEIKISDEAIQALDQLILSALEEYKVLTLIPQDIYYINNALETEIIQDLTEKIPAMISPLLLTKLGYMYNSNYIPSLIGTRIYLAVLDFTLTYNMENEGLNIKDKK